ncbi:uncharacterized protein LOC117792174 [Drosophila innubila]|uniref:uncharacterized protein LOC117792174 n=1 Tax=Drosophila innubila TaxID=198719 RepID=UPI00148BC9E2|nr:uncharacterized protein LOC117792174 [Drosophila innubila]
MCSKEHYMKFLWPYLLPEKPIKQSLIGKSCNSDTGIWFHDVNKCLLLTFYNNREAQAEIKILNLLMHRSPRETGGIETFTYPRKEPTDAEIVFGNCDCEKLFCNRRPFKTGWDKSRIDWLWDLEHLETQHQLHYILREDDGRKRFSKRTSYIQLLRPVVQVQPKKIGCWSWLRHSCGYVSDSESIDVDKSAISL